MKCGYTRRQHSHVAKIRQQYGDVAINDDPTTFRVVTNRFDPSQFDVVNNQSIAMAACFDTETAAQNWIDERLK